jgi:hypothetical protein
VAGSSEKQGNGLSNQSFGLGYYVWKIVCNQSYNFWPKKVTMDSFRAFFPTFFKFHILTSFEQRNLLTWD